MIDAFEVVITSIEKTSSWWLLLTIPGFWIYKFIPLFIGPAGGHPMIYAMGIINPNKYSVIAAQGKGRFFQFLYFLISLLYFIVYYFLIFVNLIFIIKPFL